MRSTGAGTGSGRGWADIHRGSDRRGRRNQDAFSLVELLVAAAILAILASLAAPSFSSLVSESRVADATNDLLGAILLTRSEALKRRARVTMCVSDGAGKCGVGAEWDAGWIVFEDVNANGAIDAAEALIASAGARPAMIAITGNAPVSRYVSYVATGRPQLLAGGLQMGTITICEPPFGRQLIINHVGRPRLRHIGC